jgi:hypothetical protein
MLTSEALRARVRALDGRGYPAYKGIAGAYRFAGWELRIDHVQGDPFAEPSRLRAVVSPAAAGIPAEWLATQTCRTAAADFLNRALHEALAGAAPRQGSGRSGESTILRPVEQLVEAAQTRAIGRALAWGRGRWIDGRRPLREALEGIGRALEDESLDAIDERIVGDYAEFRLHELAAALNRLRSLRCAPPA